MKTIKTLTTNLLLTLFIIERAIAQDCFHSSIVSPSPFMGNNGEVFKLADGSLWEVKHEYEHLYEYMPSVIICPSQEKLLIRDKILNVQMIFSKQHEATSSAELCTIVSDGILIAQDKSNTFLGKIVTSNDEDSIFNEFGNFGNRYSGSSIWNEFSTFGNRFNIYSPFNPHSSAPPMIIKNRQVIGYLSSNNSIPNSVPPNVLKTMCEDYF